MTEGVTFALLGSGEFEPWAEEVDRWLLKRADGDGRVLILPTASAPEGPEVFERWSRMGLEHYARLGVPAEVVSLRTREDAMRPDLAAQLADASVVFVSGGNPAFLAATLAGTPFWGALLECLERGAAYAGCSAGMSCLGELTLDSELAWTRREYVWAPGLRLFPRTYLGAHWDQVDAYLPGLREDFEARLPEDGCLIAVDERTAVVGDGVEWRVMGAGSVHVSRDGARASYPSGGTFGADLRAGGQDAP